MRLPVCMGARARFVCVCVRVCVAQLALPLVFAYRAEKCLWRVGVYADMLYVLDKSIENITTTLRVTYPPNSEREGAQNKGGSLFSRTCLHLSLCILPLIFIRSLEQAACC